MSAMKSILAAVKSWWVGCAVVLRVLAVGVLGLRAVAGAEEVQWVISGHGMEVPFRMWRSERSEKRDAYGVLVLVPGYNGKGDGMLDGRWKAFAERQGLVLLVPTFHAEGNENNRGRGYYYPEQGSGEVMEKALAEVTRRTGIATERVLFFGFSAGAHFGHRFALWRPGRVRAFVAYSAGWWSEPTAVLKDVPALILCGEADERYAPTWEFFKKGQRLGCPWVWRSYKNTGHMLTPAVRAMAEAFLAHYAGAETAVESARYGDIQTYRSVEAARRETIPEEFRICLPTAAMAEAWEKESE